MFIKTCIKSAFSADTEGQIFGEKRKLHYRLHSIRRWEFCLPKRTSAEIWWTTQNLTLPFTMVLLVLTVCMYNSCWRKDTALHSRKQIFMVASEKNCNWNKQHAQQYQFSKIICIKLLWFKFGVCKVQPYLEVLVSLVYWWLYKARRDGDLPLCQF